jgi:magnesium-transporting ATPase (P-type)
VRNTNFAYGIIVYTGMDTKIMRNSKKPPHKVSNVMKKMNKMLYTVFVFQILIIIVFAILNNRWLKSHFGLHPETGK